MNFKTELPEIKSLKKIGLDSKSCFIGSCFSDNMYAYLNNRYMQCASNPFGTVFNPFSILKQLSYISGEISFDNDNLFKSGDFFLHFDVHSKLFARDKADLLQKLESNQKIALDFIQKSDFIFITLGTALAYERIENHQIVSNCHKQSANLFKRRFLSQKEVTDSLKEMLKIINSINPMCEIIFTLSPVRHLRSGMIDNNASKSILRSAIHEVCEKTGGGYFPSYEIMMDDLRDYRYYDIDMIHPSELALAYICEKFESYYFEEITKVTFRKIEKYNAMLNHRPQNIGSDAHRVYIDKIATLKSGLTEIGIILQ